MSHNWRHFQSKLKNKDATGSYKMSKFFSPVSSKTSTPVISDNAAGTPTPSSPPQPSNAVNDPTAEIVATLRISHHTANYALTEQDYESIVDLFKAAKPRAMQL